MNFPYACLMALVALLVPPIASRARPDTPLVLTLIDGSQVNLSVKSDLSFEYSMPYGVMRIPLAEVGDVKLGVHVDDTKPYTDSISMLGSKEFKKRDAGSKFLRENRAGAYKYLLSAKEDKDLEVRTRANLLLKGYREFPEVYDSLAAKHGTFSNGYISSWKIEGKSVSLGQLSIRMSQIKRIQTILRGDRELEFSKEWTEIGFSNGATVTIQAEGQIDLWPQQPGQYVCGPRGHSTMAQNGLPGGCLMIRIGGEPPTNAGEYYSFSNRTGKIEVRVNDSPWAGQLPIGAYKIKIGNRDLDK